MALAPLAIDPTPDALPSACKYANGFTASPVLLETRAPNEISKRPPPG